MTAMHKVFGIRHHGPGSAKSLLKALKSFQPDIVLIEGPPDADKMIPFVADGDLKPPVALLVYNPKALHQAAYFPFADFSPEWQAMKYALKEKISVQFMDLPHFHHFHLDGTENEDSQQQILFEVEKSKELSEAEKEQLLIARDPLAYIAQMAGYTDSERWWEIHMESQENTEEIFDAVLELMGAVRQRLNAPEPQREMMREAYMRKVIRKAISDKFERIAVVCGAYHSPVLQDLKNYPLKTDNAILKGLKKVNTQTTWIPWTYQRISTMSGYGAGVVSPAWYKLLFHRRKDATIRWMSQLAKMLRNEGIDASSAHAIEAVRLAETLATIRHLPLPGMDELKEAAVTIFGGGNEAPVQLIEEKMIIGDAMGKVPSSIPKLPLQDDLDKKIKSLHLTKYVQTEIFKWIKEAAKEENSRTTPRGGLNIREEMDLKQSHFLHQLNILGIDFGTKFKDTRAQRKGSFKEFWKLKWKVGFAMKIIEAGMWGSTVYSASSNFVIKKCEKVENLLDLMDLVENTLFSGLTEVIPVLVHRLKNIASITKDTHQLMNALPKMVDVWKYGDTRGTDTAAIEQVIYSIVPRIFIGLPSTCVSINEEAAKGLFDLLKETNRALSILNDETLADEWEQVLLHISEAHHVHGILAGACSRILLDKRVISTEKAADHMSYFLSLGNEAADAANWIEGFLSGSGLVIIHEPKIWNILDNWVERLDMDTLMGILPLLRRTFSAFSVPERQKMLELAKRGQLAITEYAGDGMDYDKERGEQVLDTLKLLLGI
jgi:hypothetical protein